VRSLLHERARSVWDHAQRVGRVQHQKARRSTGGVLREHSELHDRALGERGDIRARIDSVGEGQGIGHVTDGQGSELAVVVAHVEVSAISVSSADDHVRDARHHWRAPARQCSSHEQ